MEVKAHKSGKTWVGQFRFGGYWFPVKKAGRIVRFATAEAARKAAEDKHPDKVFVAARKRVLEANT